MTTADQIRSLRLSLRLTQKEFAARLGVSTGTVSSWEQGRCEPGTLASRSALTQAMGEARTSVMSTNETGTA